MKQLGEDSPNSSNMCQRASGSSATCDRSWCDHIAQAAAPSRPIERGMAGPRLLAHVLVSKFADHLPLYRQSVIYAREGVELERSLLAKWVGHSAALLQPLVDALRRHVMAATKLHADDTPVPVLAPGNGKTKTGRLWVYVRDDRSSGDATPPAVWFAYTPDRKGHPPAAASRIVYRDAAGRCLCRLPGGTRCCRGSVLSSCQAAVLRIACGSPECPEYRGAGTHRRTIQGRRADPRQTTRRTPRVSTGARRKHVQYSINSTRG